MQNTILHEVEQFMADAAISDHRAGFLLAKDGRLLERLRNPNRKRPPHPDRIALIRRNIAAQRKARGLPGASS